MSTEESRQGSTKILVPLSTFIDKTRFYRALQLLATLRDPLVVLFRVVEVPQRTNPLDPDLWKGDIRNAEDFLKQSAEWLEGEGYRVATKVVTARDAAGGIVSEANSGSYAVVLMMKRRIRNGWARFFHRSTSEEVIRYANPLVLTFLAEQGLEKINPK